MWITKRTRCFLEANPKLLEIQLRLVGSQMKPSMFAAI
jgi:hypothetical protein